MVKIPEVPPARVRSLVRVRMGACLRGLAAWGAGRPVGPGVGGLVSGIGSFWEGWVFGSCGSSLLLAENYNRTTTNNTTEAQSAQRLNGGGSGPSPA